MMKIISLLIIYYLLVTVVTGQVMSVDNLLTISSIPESKLDNYLSGKGFAFAGKEVQKDTTLRIYDYRRTKKFRDIDSISRSIKMADIKEDNCITYETASLAEFTMIKSQLKASGFHCNQEAAASNLPTLLYQKKDLSVRTWIRTDTVNKYMLLFTRKVFPRARDIYYADDLLSFTSHEYLVHYFGENSVKKDVYIFSGDETATCSVLFSNSNRQVVFIWADEENRCTISSLLFGGQQNLKSSMESGRYVEENNWALKSGLRPGMSLEELRMVNGADFSFHGGKSVNSGTVIPDSAGMGKLNFKKEEVILGCLNCRDDKFSNAQVLTADESIRYGRIFFVLSIILNP